MERTFTSEVIRFDDGMRHHALSVPAAIGVGFREAGIRRLILRIGRQEYRRALQRRRDGRWHLVLGQDIMREIGLEIGERIEITLLADPEPDLVETGPEFAEVLAQDPEAKARWDSFPVGKQRSLALYVTTAKRSDTRLRRALELAEKIRTRSLHGDRE